MTTPVRIERDQDVGIVVIDNPPVNALAQPVRQGLLNAMEALEADASVRAIVLHGTGRNFIAGADVREFEQLPQPPLLNSVLLRLESCTKPVVAALHGATLGGGAELALASHFRCAASDLQFGLPEVKLGLIPGAGGTARLPRIAGVKASLDLMTRGEPIGVERARAIGVIDRVIEGDLMAGACAYAREVINSGARITRVSERSLPECPPKAFFQDYLAALPRVVRQIPAAGHIVACVEAATTESFEAALGRARTAFEICRVSSESAALRHLFFAERARAPTTAIGHDVKIIGVIGAGTMGTGIVVSCAQAGFDVVWVDSSGAALDRGRERAGATIDSAAAKGRVSVEAASQSKARVRTSNDLAAIAEADLVIEAAFEDLGVKQGIFEQLGRLCKPGTVLATNTSTLDVDVIAGASGRSADVIGMHFFSPAHVMRLIEIVLGRESSAESLATAWAASRRMGKIAVMCGNAFGFVGNRLLHAYGREKELMLLQGATPESIDRALETFGMAMGPNAVGDLAGLDIGASARRQWKGRPDDPRYYRVADMLADRGWLGQKSGRGFYRYEGSEKRRTPDPELLALIRSEGQRLGITQREISDEEIVERCILALVNEGARVLEEGIAHSAADIDTIWCNGYGFPRTRGGPMFHADTVGLPRVLAIMEKYRAQEGARYWTPAPLLESLASAGRRIADWRS
ncbi:MAG: 3-hydroxyacyl-CoA dehydrogenase [Proteobacteria bacterium]|nr:3-hydroxyacyl-CoA dehydrogenase [Pseudomonadota bacterium]